MERRDPREFHRLRSEKTHQEPEGRGFDSRHLHRPSTIRKSLAGPDRASEHHGSEFTREHPLRRLSSSGRPRPGNQAARCMRGSASDHLGYWRGGHWEVAFGGRGGTPRRRTGPFPADWSMQPRADRPLRRLRHGVAEADKDSPNGGIESTLSGTGAPRRGTPPRSDFARDAPKRSAAARGL